MEIPKELNNEIWEYCRSNNITNIDEFMLKLLKQGFTAEKFGATPTTKTIEKIVEVPVNVVDSEMTEKYTSLLKQFEELKQENKALEEALQKEKNKKDLYGE